MLTRTVSRSMSPVEHTVALAGQGTLSGEVWTTASSADVVRFLNVPYAAPPVGPLRWRPPQPPSSWEGVRSNPPRLSMCPQPDSGLLTYKFGCRRVEESEDDMLVLNVFAPAPPADGAAPTEPYPVIVYIHGGAGKFGTAHVDECAGDALASSNVVYVAINYRLGVFGFLAHPALSMEDDEACLIGDEPTGGAAGSPGGSSDSQTRGCGNYALLDQICALKWVQRHISQFGGDPSNVTIWGLSSGAQFVSTLLVCPAAAGLFHRAMVQSCCDIANMRKLTSSSDVWEGRSAEEWGVAYGEAIGCSSGTLPDEKTPEEGQKGRKPLAEKGARQSLAAPITIPTSSRRFSPPAESSPVSPPPSAAPPSPPSLLSHPFQQPAQQQPAQPAPPLEPPTQQPSPAASEEQVPSAAPSPDEPRSEGGQAAAYRRQLAAMRRVPAKRLVATTLDKASTDCYESAVDSARAHALKPRASLHALESGTFHRVPVLIGYTADDGLGAVELEQIGFDEYVVKDEKKLLALFTREFGAAAAEAIEHYTVGQAASGRKRIRAALGGLSKDLWYSAATWHMANAISTATGAPPTYVYHFTQKVHLGSTPCTPKAAWHGCDTTFWNGEEPIRPEACAHHNHPRPSMTTLGKTMFGYLLRFAASGNPNGAGLPAWDAHSAARRGAVRVMELGPSIGMVDVEAEETARHDFCSREFFNKRLRTQLARGEEASA